MAILNYYTENMGIKYILLQVLQVGSEADLLFVEFQLTPHVVPVGIHGTGRYPYDISYLLGGFSVFYERRNLGFPGGEVQLLYLMQEGGHDFTEIAFHDAEIGACLFTQRAFFDLFDVWQDELLDV